MDKADKEKLSNDEKAALAQVEASLKMHGESSKTDFSSMKRLAYIAVGIFLVIIVAFVFLAFFANYE